MQRPLSVLLRELDELLLRSAIREKRRVVRISEDHADVGALNRQDSVESLNEARREARSDER